MARVRLKRVTGPSWVAPASSRAPYVGRFGRLGVTASTSMVGAGASVGTAIMPGIGTAVGAIVGLVAGSLLNKQYLNVADANAGEDAAVSAFNQYRSIAGQVPGRQLGVPAMNAIWDGAVYSGLFPLNNQRKCFHEGCLKYPGNPDWVHGTFYDGANNPFTFAASYAQFRQAKAGTQQMSASAGFAPQVITGVADEFVRASLMGLGMELTTMPSSGMIDIANRFADLAPPPNTVIYPPYYFNGNYFPGGYSPPPPGAQIMTQAQFNQIVAAGSAAVGTAPIPAPVTVPDAVTFIDQFFIPASQRDSPPWAVPSSPLEHQILYDAADAYLATQSLVTVPYVGSQPQAVTAPTVLPAVSTIAPGLYTNPTDAAFGRNPIQATPNLSPFVTPLLPATPYAIAVSGGGVTSAVAATSANLDASMAAQGFTRVGTTPNGVPLYSAAGQVYAYQNGQLFPAGSVAQLATTGGAGSGVSVPAVGVDPQVLAAIQGAINQGFSAVQAAQAGANVLATQGVPITPQVQDQLNAAAQQPAVQPITISPMMIGAGLLVLVLIARR